MRKLRKGFTLLELLVVIGVMGILSSTAMIAGQQATDGARATTIAEGLEKAASAMMMFYADNAENIAVNGIVASATDGKISKADLLDGANAYLKAADALVSETATAGKYAIQVVGTAPAQEWWVVYKLPDTDIAGVGPILKNKANRMGLMTDSSSGEAYDGESDTVAMKVRGTASE